MKQVFLVNQKPKETPQFENAFRSTFTSYDIALEVCNATDFAYYNDKNNPKIHVFKDGAECLLNDDTFFFVRSWRGRKSATATLSFVLSSRHIKQIDIESNQSESIKNSKISQIFQTKNTPAQFPNTWIGSAAALHANKDRIRSTIPDRWVLKSRGGVGKNVWLHDSFADLLNHIDELKKDEGTDERLYAVQEYIKNECDIRVIVMYGKVLAAVKRSSIDGFYNNVSRGATATLTDITDAEAEIAIAATQAVGLDLAGVDLVRTPEGTLVFELNKAPDVLSSEQTGFDIPTAIAEEIVDRYFSE